jgi:hypothetical protein
MTWHVVSQSAKASCGGPAVAVCEPVHPFGRAPRLVRIIPGALEQIWQICKSRDIDAECDAGAWRAWARRFEAIWNTVRVGVTFESGASSWDRYVSLRTGRDRR